ncbi:polyprenol phosphomannose-dependent alpha 1,6 mannosyltransferase MptB [Cryptosporangium arvum]|uniref:polyprenol phosphomannose-dependent alpha 1,6 mannosyltransferase MptB n=1 Tax=Cryptosporangium arvum TaxID=80871 RepID=UPI0012EDD779|nr:polyprenol phosphomannose-dependent alpha 1,6 mannosyltransferase MptB [Cryptosporangium arvum]
MSAPATAVGVERDRLTRSRWLGLAGSALVAVGGLGAGALPRPDPLSDAPVLRLLRHGAGPGVCIALAAVGMALLVLAWWRVRPADAPWITRTAALWAVPLALTPPLFSRDLYIYGAQGLLLARGYDPYQVGPDAMTSGPGVDWLTSISPTWAGTPAPYGPLFLFFSSRIADAAHGNLVVAVFGLRALAVLGVLALALLVPRLATAFGAEPGRAQWLVIANPLVLSVLIAGGHNEALMLPFLAGALLVAVRAGDRLWVAAAGAGALAGFAVATKVSAVVALPFVVLLVAAARPAAPGWRWWWHRVQVGAVAGAATVLVVALVCLAAGLDAGFVHALSVTNGMSTQWTSIPTGWGLAAGWFTTADDTVLDAARALGTLVTAVLLVVLWWRVRHDGPGRIAGACAAAFLVLAFLGASFHPWYLVWALVPLAAATDAWPRFTRAIAVLSAALCFLVLPNGYNLARATEVPGTILDLLLTAAAVGYVSWKAASHERA